MQSKGQKSSQNYANCADTPAAESSIAPSTHASDGLMLMHAHSEVITRLLQSERAEVTRPGSGSSDLIRKPPTSGARSKQDISSGSGY